jgi:hypothetical protein
LVFGEPQCKENFAENNSDIYGAGTADDFHHWQMEHPTNFTTVFFNIACKASALLHLPQELMRVFTMPNFFECFSQYA